jgi:hypothetical protein
MVGGHPRSDFLPKPKEEVGFAAHARRRVVERCFAWIGRNRRLAKDVEAPIAFPPCWPCPRLGNSLVHAFFNRCSIELAPRQHKYFNI